MFKDKTKLKQGMTKNGSISDTIDKRYNVDKTKVIMILLFWFLSTLYFKDRPLSSVLPSVIAKLCISFKG